MAWATIGCHDMALGLTTRKLQGTEFGSRHSFWCRDMGKAIRRRDTILGVVTWVGRWGVATLLLMSRHGLAFLVSRPETGVATGYGLGKEASCRDMIFGVETWLGCSASRNSTGVSTGPGLGGVVTYVLPARSMRAACARQRAQCARSACALCTQPTCCNAQCYELFGSLCGTLFPSHCLKKKKMTPKI